MVINVMFCKWIGTDSKEADFLQFARLYIFSHFSIVGALAVILVENIDHKNVIPKMFRNPLSKF